MVLDMNYWGKVIRRLIILIVMILGIYIVISTITGIAIWGIATIIRRGF